MKSAKSRTFAAVLLSGCTAITAESLPDQTVDGSFWRSSFNWTSGEKVAFAYKIFNISGSVAVCGVYAESPGGDSNQSAFNDRLVQTAYLKVAGETLVNDISFFSKGRYEKYGRASGEANCVLTDEPWDEKISKGRTSINYAKTHFTVYN